jgi:hypothetical protein
LVHKESTQITKENSTKNRNGKHAEGDNVGKKSVNQKKQRSRILQAYENKYPTHLKMAM